MNISEIEGLIKDVPDFPKEGVLFKDITPVLENAQAFKSIAKKFADSIDSSITKLAAIESRGFIFACAVSQHLEDVGVVLVRKPGKLPRKTYSQEFDLEYGQDTLEIHEDAFCSSDKVMVIDDVLATGGTAQAVEKLIDQTQAQVIGHRFFMEIDFLKGRQKLQAPVKSFIQC